MLCSVKPSRNANLLQLLDFCLPVIDLIPSGSSHSHLFLFQVLLCDCIYDTALTHSVVCPQHIPSPVVKPKSRLSTFPTEQAKGWDRSTQPLLHFIQTVCGSNRATSSCLIISFIRALTQAFASEKPSPFTSVCHLCRNNDSFYLHMLSKRFFSHLSLNSSIGQMLHLS